METVVKPVYRLNIGDYYSVILDDGHLCFVYGFSENAGFLFTETIQFAEDVLQLNSSPFKGHHYTVVVYRRDSFNGIHSFSAMYSRSIN